MGKNLLVINVDIRETRVALIENGIIAELHLERESSKGTLGNIYLGKVSRVLPGMQAAFIDVGLERAAFLHVEDLIRPDDFEAYLAGHRRPGEEERTSSRGRAARETAPPEAGALDAAGPEGPPGEAEAAEPHEPLAKAELETEERFEAESHLEDSGSEVPIELPTALDVLGGPSGEAFAGVGTTEPLHDELDDDGDLERDSSEDDDVLVASSAPSDSEDVSAEDDEEVDIPSYEVEPASLRSSEDASAAWHEDSDIEADAAEEHGDEAPPEAAASGPGEGAPLAAEPKWSAAQTSSAPHAAEGGVALATAASAPAEEIPAVPRARGGRSSRGRRDGRVRRSGRTRDRANIGAEGAAPEQAAREPAREAREPGRDGREPAREARDRGGRGQQGGQARDRDQRSSRDQRGRGREQGQAQARDGKGQRGAKGQQGSRTWQNEPPRISKSTPIREVVREGQEVIVQISKEPIGTKGARVTSHISLPGRYVVYLPTVDHIGISKRIGSEKERSRLRESIEAMKPPQGGLIVRTLAEGLTKKQLKADVGYLVRLWGEVAKKRESGVRAPAVLYTELDLVLKTARDLFTDDIEKIVIDDREEYIRLRRFVEMFMPERADAVELYEGTEPIFDAYGIEDEIQRALSRKVPLPSGGHLIIDQAEALTAIDVNTGRFVGKGSKDLEETILTTNLEAVEEIAYQLRFRNIGGLIILDLIDMERAQNREKVRRRLEELLSKDKAKTTLNRISDLGLIEMTRKRTRESLGRTILEPCFYCDGTGQLQSKQTIAYEILRQIRRERSNLPGYSVVVNAHPAVIDLLKNDERIAVQEAERLFQRRIDLVPRKEYHLEQFDLQGR
jgi:ribonuclease G